MKEGANVVFLDQPINCVFLFRYEGHFDVTEKRSFLSCNLLVK